MVSILAPHSEVLRDGPQGGSNVVLLTQADFLRSEVLSVEVFAARAERSDVRELPLGIRAPLIALQEPTVAVLAPDRSIVRFDWYTPLPRYHDLSGVREQFASARHVFPSAHLRDRWLEHQGIVPRDHTYVLPNGIDLDHFSPDGRLMAQEGSSAASCDRENRSLRVGFAGRWTEGKGLDDLLTAWESVGDRCPGTELALAGGPDLWTRTDGAENRVLGERARALAEDINISMAGKLPREMMPAFWRSLDVAVVPSKREEMLGLVALEAMACGVPVVATENGAFPWLLDDGGITVQGADPQAPVDAIVCLLWDAELRADMARRVRRRAEEFPPARMGNELTDLVLKVAGERHEPESVGGSQST